MKLKHIEMEGFSTFPGFLYHTDKVVVNPRPQPIDELKTIDDCDNYSKWLEHCIEVENSYWGKHPNDEYQNCWHVGIGLNYIVVENGLPCTYKISGDKAVITELL